MSVSLRDQSPWKLDLFLDLIDLIEKYMNKFVASTNLTVDRHVRQIKTKEFEKHFAYITSQF